MIGPQALNRRTMLRGAGAMIGLPLLDAMLPHVGFAQGGKSATPPRRFAAFFVPNGMHMQGFTPTKPGTDFELPSILEPMAPYREYFNVMSGLTLDKARANGDGAGDHARSSGVFLTATKCLKTGGANIRAGISLDQLIASKIGGNNRFESLELSCEPASLAGSCDSGYSCAYSNTISWRTPTMPLARELDPRQLFDRLFSENSADAAAMAARREARRKSILDAAVNDAKVLNGRLGRTDQQKLDEYLESIRAVERQLAKTDKDETITIKRPPRPTGVPADYAEHIELMGSLMVLAFQADITRVATFMIANEGSNRPYRGIGVREGHHELSHHGKSDDKQEKIRKINLYHMTAFAKIMEKFAAVKEQGASLLDNCMMVYGSGIGDGDRHNHDDLPLLLIGKGGGTIKTGRHIVYRKDTPLANLWVSLAQRMGVSINSFGDSTGQLDQLT